MFMPCSGDSVEHIWTENRDLEGKDYQEASKQC